MARALTEVRKALAVKTQVASRFTGRVPDAPRVNPGPSKATLVVEAFRPKWPPRSGRDGSEEDRPTRGHGARFPSRVGFPLHMAERRPKEPIVEHAVEYDSILVAFEDDAYNPEAVATAIKLAARRRRGIHVLVTLTVPAAMSSDADLPEQEAKARRTIDAARALGGRRVTGHWEKVRAGEAGRRIIAAAGEVQARALVMSPPPLRTRSSILGRTLEYVLTERPCRVIIESPPAHERKAQAASKGG